MTWTDGQHNVESALGLRHPSEQHELPFAGQRHGHSPATGLLQPKSAEICHRRSVANTVRAAERWESVRCSLNTGRGNLGVLSGFVHFLP